MLLIIVCLAGLAPGVATAWYVHHKHGWTLAVLAGIGVTISLPGLLLVTLLAVPPFGFVVGLAASLTALNAYDDGRVWAGTAWAAAAVIALSCAGWSM